MANTKLLKVMDYLINEQEDKARELLHQIFIEKARAIHEEMINDDMDEDMDEAMGGDHDPTHEIQANLEEIDAEHAYGSGSSMSEEEDMDVEDAEEDLSDELEDDDMTDMADMEDPDDMDMGDEEVEGEEDADMTQVDMDHEGEDDQIHDLEQAIAELKAEFAALKDEVEGGHDHDDNADHEAGEEHEDEMAEAWAMDDTSDFDDLAENVDLEAVHAAKGGEVGSGRYAPAETNKHSPVPSSQRDMMGARPVKTGQGTKASGYDRQSAPDSKSMGLSNRRRDAEDGKRPVSKEGDASALLNKGTSAGYGAVNTKSPISGRK